MRTSSLTGVFHRRAFWLCLALALITLAAYAGVLNLGFVFDDDLYLVYGQPVRAGFTAEGIVCAFTTTEACNWHPLTWLSHMAVTYLVGRDPRWHHLANLALHVANTLMLFLVLGSLTGSFWPSVVTAALFAVHPLHVESVAWISERKDVLSVFFFMLVLWSYRRYVARPGTGRYLAVAGLFAAGLAAKPMLVTLPFLLLLLDVWPRGRLRVPPLAPNSPHRPRTATVLLEKLPLLVLSTIVGMMTIAAQKGGGAMIKLTIHPPASRAANALVSYMRYLGKTFWPSNLAVFYTLPLDGWPAWQVAGSASALLLISLAAALGARRRPYLFTGWFWFLGSLVPVIGLVQVGMQSMADRYTYLPLIGVFAAAAWGIPEILRRLPRKELILGASSALVVVTLSAATFTQTALWKDEITVYKHAIEVTKENWFAHTNLGAALFKLGRYDEGMDHSIEALRINPGSPLAGGNLAFSLAGLGSMDPTMRSFTLTVPLPAIPGRAADSLYLVGYLSTAGDWESEQNNMGLGYLVRGKAAEAARRFALALKLNPSFAAARNNFGCLLAVQGNQEKALGQLREAVRLEADLAQAWSNIDILEHRPAPRH